VPASPTFSTTFLAARRRKKTSKSCVDLVVVDVDAEAETRSRISPKKFRKPPKTLLRILFLASEPMFEIFRVESYFYDDLDICQENTFGDLSSIRDQKPTEFWEGVIALRKHSRSTPNRPGFELQKKAQHKKGLIS